MNGFNAQEFICYGFVITELCFKYFFGCWFFLISLLLHWEIYQSRNRQSIDCWYIQIFFACKPNDLNGSNDKIFTWVSELNLFNWK